MIFVILQLRKIPESIHKILFFFVIIILYFCSIVCSGIFAIFYICFLYPTWIAHAYEKVGIHFCIVKFTIHNVLLLTLSLCEQFLYRASFELEAGAVGQTTDFKEGSKRLEWCLKKARLHNYHFIFFLMIYLFFFRACLDAKILFNIFMFTWGVVKHIYNGIAYISSLLSSLRLKQDIVGP